MPLRSAPARAKRTKVCPYPNPDFEDSLAAPALELGELWDERLKAIARSLDFVEERLRAGFRRSSASYRTVLPPNSPAQPPSPPEQASASSAAPRDVDKHVLEALGVDAT